MHRTQVILYNMLSMLPPFRKMGLSLFSWNFFLNFSIFGVTLPGCTFAAACIRAAEGRKKWGPV